MIVPLVLPSVEELRRLFSYDPLTAVLAWRVRPHKRARVYPGDPAGSEHHSGCIQVGIESTIYLVHRIIWKLETGVEPGPIIDHENGVRSDNRWRNLREATSSQNGMNRVTPNHHRGVHFMARTGKFGAQIKHNLQHHWLGCYDTPEEACAVYRAAAETLHDQFGRQGQCACR